MGGQEYELGEDTKVRLGTSVRVFVFMAIAIVGGASALWIERATRREADTDLRNEFTEALRKQREEILEKVAQTYVKEESSNYRAKQLSDELQKAIDKLNTELAYLRRDVTGISDTVREIPTISAQLKVLQEKK